MRVVVVGAGVTGLACAYRLQTGLAALVESRKIAEAAVHVVEAAPRVGGWIGSRRIAAGKEPPFLVEAGPRTLRAAGAAGGHLLELVRELGLDRRLVSVPKSAPGATRRFLLGSGGDRLVEIPGTAAQLMSAVLQPGERGFLARALSRAAAADAASFNTFDKVPDDETLYAFAERRFGRVIADTVVSALARGVFAGDAAQLELRACFPDLWAADRAGGSILRALAAQKPPPSSDAWVRDLQRDTSVYTFQNGLEELPKALTAALARPSAAPAAITLNTAVKAIDRTPDGAIVRLASGETLQASAVVACVPAPQLQKLLGSGWSKPVQNAAANVAVGAPGANVAVVSFTVPRAQLDPSGFGYLVPKTASTAGDADSHVLGCIFDTSIVRLPGTNERYSVVTGMLGGDRGLPQGDLVESARRHILQRHLGMPADASLAAIGRLSLARGCIPQYRPGHSQRVASFDEALSNEPLFVSGAWYRGVGVPQCVSDGFQTALRVLGRL